MTAGIYNFNNTMLHSICPGINYSTDQNSTDITIRYTTNCRHIDLQYFDMFDEICDNSTICCQLYAERLQEFFVFVELNRLEYWCYGRRWEIQISDKIVKCDFHSLDELFYQSSNNFIKVLHLNKPSVKLTFHTVKRLRFIEKHVSHCSGYKIVPYMWETRLLKTELKCTPGHAAIISINKSFSPGGSNNRGVKNLLLIYQKENENESDVQHMGVSYFTPARVVFATYIRMQVNYIYISYIRSPLVVLYVSMLLESDMPHKLPSGLFNCSVASYPVFQDHVHCNLKPECEDGEDETGHCSFSSPQCKGMVASRNKCFKPILLDVKISPQTGSLICASLGGRLASLKTRREQNDSRNMFRNFDWFPMAFGYSSGWFNVHFIYSKFPKWSDATLIYTFPLSFEYHPLRYRCSMKIWPETHWRCNPMGLLVYQALLCELPTLVQPLSSQSVFFHSRSSYSVFKNTKQSLVVCKNSESSHSFPFSNLKRTCGETRYPLFHSLMNTSHWQHNSTDFEKKPIADTGVMFACGEGITTVSYTFVCDFEEDCSDKSDESFCQHSSCDGNLCSNCQCVLHSQRCNEYSDCLDDSDEVGCSENEYYLPVNIHLPMTIRSGRLYITLDGSGYFIYQKMRAGESCPNTYYSCSTEWLHCLPVYTRCNGYNDCVYGEDEQNCEKAVCPSYYRCRESKVCVHEDNLCDGWSQCPQRDDEMLCDFACPESCVCLGQSFWCSSSFPTELFQTLRFLDGAGSGMSLTDFTKHDYLIFLKLTGCSISNISAAKSPNLQFLDLSNNRLGSLDVGQLVELLKLKTLSLASNPLRTMTHRHYKSVHYTMKRLDMSQTYVNIVDVYLYLPCLKYLNVSSSAVQTIGCKGFKNMPEITELDVRSNPFNGFPLDLFSKSQQLHRIWSSDYRLCCDNIFPKETNNMKCETDDPILSSCSSLIPSDLHLVLFWLMAVTAVLGNLACCLSSFRIQNLFGATFLNALSHLHVTDVCMGIHVAIATAANEVFDGQYIYFEKAWTRSMTCKASGFLSFLSNEVSVLVILFITLDHILILYSLRYSKILQGNLRNMKFAITWFPGICLSVTPFLPGLSHWGVSDQSGLCRLALFQGFQPHQQFRWFHVTVAINFIVCLFIAGGQGVIFNLTPAYRITLDPAHRSMYSAVHLMRPVAVMEVLCWLSFGVVTTMIAAGMHMLDKVHGTLVVFVLPLNSALNPLIYTWTVVTQKRGKDREEKMLAIYTLKFDALKVRSLKK